MSVDDMVTKAKAEGCEADRARDAWRAGLTDSTVSKAESVGLTLKDLLEVFNMFGSSSVLVMVELFGRIKK